VSWRDAFGLAFTSIHRRLSRAVLTVLAVALASALLSSLLIAGDVARSRVLDQVSRGGPLAGVRVDAAAPVPGALDRDSPKRLGDPKTIDDQAVAKIRALPGVRSVLSVTVNPVFVSPSAPAVIATAPPEMKRRAKIAEPKEFGESLVGANLRRVADLPVTVIDGRLPSPDATNEVAVTPSYLERLGLDTPDAKYVIGTEITYGSARVVRIDGRDRPRGRWVRATVVGVVAQDVDNRGEILAPQSAVTAARSWTTAGDNPRVFETPESPYAALFVVADGLDEVPAVRRLINDIGYSTSAPEQLIANVKRYVHVVEIVLGGIGLIGLIIAALGITNAMLAAVRERRREIGVLKAIGARDRDVRRVFLIEAATLGALGGGLGTVGGWAIASGLAAVVNNYLNSQGFQGVAVGFPVTVALAGVVGAAVLALIAGTLPAQRAARLPARQAMGDR
jgi:cell division protein FtsX